jgi:hypothetical protein
VENYRDTSPYGLIDLAQGWPTIERKGITTPMAERVILRMHPIG